jgi:hypothetical protein
MPDCQNQISWWGCNPQLSNLPCIFHLTRIYSIIAFDFFRKLCPSPHAEKEIETLCVYNSRDCSWRQNVIVNCKTKLGQKLWRLWTRFSNQKEIYITISDLWKQEASVHA